MEKMSEFLKKTIKTCGKHGDYEAVLIAKLGNRETFSLCPTCVAENEAKEQEAHPVERLVFGPDPATGVPFRYIDASLDGFISGGDRAKEGIKKAFRRYIDSFRDNRTKGRSLILYGECGTGKTHLACAMAKEIHKQGFKVVYTTVKKLGQQIKKTFNVKGFDNEHEKIMRIYSTVDLVILDEVMGSEFDMGLVHEIVDERYLNMLPTILIANFKVSELSEMLGERVVDRIQEGDGAFVHFGWKSYRPGLKNPERPKLKTISELVREV